MKVLITGATGTIGSEIFRHCLAHPDITSVVAITRRSLPETISSHPKLTSVVMQDFKVWPRELLQSHSDAVGMIWALGGSEGNATVNLEFPLAFTRAMAEVLESEHRVAGARVGKIPRQEFRFIYLSGAFVERDQNKKLFLERDPPNKDICILPAARKLKVYPADELATLKGVTETESLAFAREHAHIWQTLIVRPGVVLPKDSIATWMLGWALGENWVIGREELAAFMTDLCANGADEKDKTTFENSGILHKGRALLQRTDNGILLSA
ncbi:uncharacterized protein PpBr36_06134 [Pyricularia pennisetigena]|uniref:uncharacterized protein n=1 Tax=Pyricularia pennisetigena TaxID=1578925 RepID=UPI00114F8901|nr:uncharacterized protein PpBr36_06134 [Pyricularia pennisetigena]TLS23415.1 hypothetical protein PpBr36_06134 [Pyricularia pennisetigena]